MRWLPLTIALLVLGCAHEPLGTADISASGDRGSIGVCTVEATGTLPAGDSFAGLATLFADASTEGTWTHLTPEHSISLCAAPDANPGHCGHGNGNGYGHERHGNGTGDGHERHHDGTARDEFVGTVTSLQCLVDGNAYVLIHGLGSWNGAPGFTMMAELSTSILAEPTYEIHVFDPGAVEVYGTGPVHPAASTIVITAL